MTRTQYLDSGRRVVVYGGFLVCLVGIVVVLLLITAISWGGPALQRFKECARQQGQGEFFAYFLGLLCGLLLALLPLFLVLPLVLCDRRYGLRCPRCARSITLGCAQGKVLRSGQCCRCQAILFTTENGLLAT